MEVYYYLRSLFCVYDMHIPVYWYSCAMGVFYIVLTCTTCDKLIAFQSSSDDESHRLALQEVTGTVDN